MSRLTHSSLRVLALPLFGLTALVACGSDDANVDATSSATTGTGGASTTTSTTTSAGGAGGATTTLSGGNTTTTTSGSGGAGGSVDPGKKLGDACSDAGECGSGFCADGVCCDTACDGACSACSTPAGAMVDGTCLANAVKSGQDLGTCDDTNGGCGGACSCDAGGMCSKKPLGVTELSAGGNHTCALFTDGTVKCWGANASGQLGLGDTTRRGDKAAQMGDKLPFLEFGNGKTVKKLGAGDTHNCAILNDGSLKCWGGNADGQLGLGDSAARGNDSGEMGEFLPPVNLGKGRTATAVALGTGHTCALLDDATVKCWGLNDAGQLGLGNTTDRGDNPGEMGDSLPAVDLGMNAKVVAIAAGSEHTCALLDDGKVKCWGGSDFGQLGLGSTLRRGDNGGEMGDSLPAVNLGTNKKAVAITAGFTRTCALLDDATVKCWGSGITGQLGQGDAQNRGDNSGEMGDNLKPIDLGMNKTVLAHFGGAGHVCAKLDDESTKCWGRNLDGQLGLGDTSSRGNGPNEMGDKLPVVDFGKNEKASSLSLGFVHSCAILSSGAVKCWGKSDEGQLGLGDPLTRGNEPNEMGDNLPAVKLLGM
jgi:alpha-tubulin suppressor-like RCC1 family protein